MLRIALLIAISSALLPCVGAAEEGEEGWRKATTGLSRGSFSRVSGPIQPRPEAEGDAAGDDAAGPEGVPASAAPDGESAPDGEDAEAEEPAVLRGATYGKACVIGVDGSVLYAPPGKDCGGSGGGASTTRHGRVRAGGPSDNHCIYGSDGRVIHRPADADC